MNITLLLALISLCCCGIGFYLCAENRARRIWRYILLAFAVIVCLLSPWMFADAQEVIHARTGQVVAVDAARKTLTIKTLDGDKILFQFVATHEPLLPFDKTVREKTVPVGTYSKLSANVVVFYYGFGNLTAVAVKELGTDPIKKSTGSVASFDRHDHSLTLKTAAAEPQKLVLNDDTIVDTSDGVVRMADYKPSKGAQLRCLTKPESQVALLVAPQ